MGPPSYVRSIVDQIVSMRRMTIHGTGADKGAGHFPKEQHVCVTYDKLQYCYTSFGMS